MALVAKWTGEGLTTATIPDMSGNGNHLTNSGVTQVTSSPFAQGGVALAFDGSASASINPLGLDKPGSICLSVLWDGTGGGQDMCFWGDAGANACSVQGLYSNKGIHLDLDFLNESESVDPAVTGDHYHVVVTRDAAGALVYYVNDMATPISSIPSPASSDVLFNYVSLGAEGGTGLLPLFGILGNIEIHDAPLSLAERQAWLANGTVVAPPVPELVPSIGKRFILTLSGSADSTTDIDLPISYVNARLRSGSPSYLQVTLPYTAAYASAVSARQNGDLSLFFVDADGAHAVTTVDFETLQISRGESSSIVLTGHRQTTNASPSSHDKPALSMQTGTTNTNAIVPGYDYAVLPGDSVTVEGITYTIDTVSLQATVGSIQTQLIGG